MSRKRKSSKVIIYTSSNIPTDHQELIDKENDRTVDRKLFDIKREKDKRMYSEGIKWYINDYGDKITFTKTHIEYKIYNNFPEQEVCPNCGETIVTLRDKYLNLKLYNLDNGLNHLCNTQ